VTVPETLILDGSLELLKVPEEILDAFKFVNAGPSP